MVGLEGVSGRRDLDFSSRPAYEPVVAPKRLEWKSRILSERLRKVCVWRDAWAGVNQTAASAFLVVSWEGARAMTVLKVPIGSRLVFAVFGLPFPPNSSPSPAPFSHVFVCLVFFSGGRHRGWPICRFDSPWSFDTVVVCFGG